MELVVVVADHEKQLDEVVAVFPTPVGVTAMHLRPEPVEDVFPTNTQNYYQHGKRDWFRPVKCLSLGRATRDAIRAGNGHGTRCRRGRRLTSRDCREYA